MSQEQKKPSVAWSACFYADMESHGSQWWFAGKGYYVHAYGVNGGETVPLGPVQNKQLAEEFTKALFEEEKHNDTGRL